MTEEQGPEMDQEDDDEMDEDFAPGMADHLRSMITMGNAQLPHLWLHLAPT